jgi:hypothetical protein
MLGNALIAVIGRHPECLDHRAMRGIHELAKLAFVAAFDQVKFQQGHGWTPEKRALM